MDEIPKIDTLAKSFDDLFIDLKKWHEEQAKEEYDVNRFKWFRPERITDITDPVQLCEPYSLEELNKQGKEYIDPAKEDGCPARKDYSVLDYQVSLLQSFARAFNARHTGKLRCFSHSAGVSDIMRAPETGVIDEMYTCAKAILAAQ